MANIMIGFINESKESLQENVFKRIILASIVMAYGYSLNCQARINFSSYPKIRELAMQCNVAETELFNQYLETENYKFIRYPNIL
jgi:hypothetical protein